MQAWLAAVPCQFLCIYGQSRRIVGADDLKVDRKNLNCSIHCAAGLTLLCQYPEDARSSGLLINGEQQLADSGKLCGRPFLRFRVSDLAMSGKWKYGIELQSAHMASVKHCNIVGYHSADDARGCLAGISMHGTGSPTDHGIEGCSIYHFDNGAYCCCVCAVLLLCVLSCRVVDCLRARAATSTPFSKHPVSAVACSGCECSMCSEFRVSSRRRKLEQNDEV